MKIITRVSIALVLFIMVIACSLSVPKSPQATVITIGRLDTSDIFLDDQTVSRKHAQIRVKPDGVIEIMDIGSRNGTGLNGDIVPSKVWIPVGPDDVVSFGTSVRYVSQIVNPFL